MFGFLKKKEMVTPEWKPTFVMRLIDSAIERPDSVARLNGLCTLWNQLRELEKEYQVECMELDILRDELANAFADCNSPDVTLAAALSIDLLSGINFDFTARDDFLVIEPHLQNRLINLYVQTHLDELIRHQTEYVPGLQHAFHADESRRVPLCQRGQVLEQEFGVYGWESLQTMNPKVIFEPIFPSKDK